jgi:hypothetical protein
MILAKVGIEPGTSRTRADSTTTAPHMRILYKMAFFYMLNAYNKKFNIVKNLNTILKNG